MKRLSLLLLMILTLTALYPDNSGDKLSPVKFRGKVHAVFTYHPGRQEGIASNNISPVTYEQVDYTTSGDPAYNHHSRGDLGRRVGSQGVEFKLFSEYALIAPFLSHDTPLLKNNNIALKFKFDISPVAISGGMELIWEPAAFLYFNAGTMIGSGWNIPGLATGQAINNWGGFLTNRPEKMLTEDNFGGPIMFNWFSATFQFDLAALTPERVKRWTHIVFTATPRLEHRLFLNYSYYNLTYEWEADHGFSMNGWYLTFDAIFGYRIPVIIDKRKEEAQKKRFLNFVKHRDFMITAAVIFQIERMHLTHFGDSPMAAGGWGSDFVPLRFGPALQFDLPCNYFAGMALHFKNGIQYTSSTIGNNYFMDRVYEDWYLTFERIGFMFGWNF